MTPTVNTVNAAELLPKTRVTTAWERRVHSRRPLYAAAYRAGVARIVAGEDVGREAWWKELAPLSLAERHLIKEQVGATARGERGDAT